MNTTPLKPGFKTSEFYIAAVNDVVGILIALGYVSAQQGDALAQAIVQVIGGLMIIASTAIYLYTRYKLKSNQAAVSTTVPPLPLSTPDTAQPANPVYIPN